MKEKWNEGRLRSVILNDDLEVPVGGKGGKQLHVKTN